MPKTAPMQINPAALLAYEAAAFVQAHRATRLRSPSTAPHGYSNSLKKQKMRP